MSYDNPTVEEFKARFPEFAAVDDAVVISASEEADSRVDTSWLEKDYKIAKMLYTAHVLTLDGHGTKAEAKLASLSQFGLSRVKSGTLDVGFSQPFRRGGIALTGLQSTSYGQRFYSLMKVNHPGVAVTNAS